MRYKVLKDALTGEVQADAILQIDDLGVTSRVPFDLGNADYQRYLAWLAEGNEPEPAE